MAKQKNIFRGKRILVTGGTGSIGKEIVFNLLKHKPSQIRIFSRDESKQYELEKELERLNTKVNIRFLIGDIRDRERLEKALGEIHIVFHAAALKHVPYCEYNPFEAIKTNVHGTQNVIDMAIKNNVEKVIAISTDKAVYPNSILGITKLLMERMIVSSRHYLGQSKTRLAVVRFGNVLNSRGSVIPLWIDQINKGGPVTVTNPDMQRFFMSTQDAVNLTFKAAEEMRGGEVFVLKMDEFNILEMAKKIIDENANGRKIEIKITGNREREKIKERLFTDEEEQNMIEKKDMYIILPSESALKQYSRTKKKVYWLNGEVRTKSIVKKSIAKKAGKNRKPFSRTVKTAVIS